MKRSIELNEKEIKEILAAHVCSMENFNAFSKNVTFVISPHYDGFVRATGSSTIAAIVTEDEKKPGD